MWQFDTAVQRGKEMLIRIVNVVDGVEVNAQTLGWTRSSGQPGDDKLSKSEYKARIKEEVRAVIDQLNTETTEIDISDEIRPSSA